MVNYFHHLVFPGLGLTIPLHPRIQISALPFAAQKVQLPSPRAVSDIVDDRFSRDNSQNRTENF